MADENKNQDPEEENKSESNDDDFGLPDFEFEALEDDDDDEVESSSETSEENKTESDEEVPSIDDGDLEDLDLDLEGVDLEGVEDIDLDNLDDLGDLDLEDLDLDDLDSELEDLDKTIEDTGVPVAASAENVKDIFDDAPADSTEEPFEGDGEFYEEESFGDFDGEFDEEAPAEVIDSGPGESAEVMESDPLESAEIDEEEVIAEPGEFPSPEDQGDFDSSIFDDDTEGLELGSGAEEAVPFAKKDLPGEYRHDEEPEEEVSDEEIKQSKSKFVRIVVLGTIMFVAIGAGFLYWNGTLFGDGSDGDKKEVAENKAETKKPVVKKEKENETAGSNKAKQAADKTTTSKTEKPVAAKQKAQKPKVQPKQKTTKPVAKSTSGVSTLNAKTGQGHIIVGSFLDESTAKAFAAKLASKGESPSIIPPFNGAPNYRVAVASFSNFTQASNSLEKYRGTYNGAWVLKY